MISDKDKQAIERGVRDSFDFWLSQHDVSFPNLLEKVITKTFREWLDDNSEVIIERIAQSTEPDDIV